MSYQAAISVLGEPGLCLMVDDQPGDDLAHRLPLDLGGNSFLFEEIVETGPDMRVAIS
jgi:hypothetical protein